MKKLFLLSCFATSLIASSAFAKTENSYLSLDLVNSHGSFYENYSRTNTNGEYRHFRPSHHDVGYGPGLTYTYAFNHEGFFFAPGIFAEYNNLTMNSKGGGTDRSLKVDSRFGAKANLGYDIVDNFALYLTGGYSGIYYHSKNYHVVNGESQYTTVGGVTGSWFYGAGFKFDLDDSFALLGEFTTQNFSARTKIPENNIGYAGTYKARLDVYKIGVAYKF